MAAVIVSTHPIVQHHLATLRDVRTNPAEFRRSVRTLALLLGQEATADLATVESEVATPLGRAPAKALTDVIGVVPIFRAGLGMAEGIMELLPQAEVWHIGLFRDEATLRPTEYYNKFPARPARHRGLAGRSHARDRGIGGCGLRDHQASRGAAAQAALADRGPGRDCSHVSARCPTCRSTWQPSMSVSTTTASFDPAWATRATGSSARSDAGAGSREGCRRSRLARWKQRSDSPR